MNSFSFIWSDSLEIAIKAAASRLDKSYPISLRAGNDFEAIKAAVNQGIDSHLEAISIINQREECDVLGKRWFGEFAPATLHVLVRRLMEAGNEAADSLASSICETLNIELI